MLIVMLCQIVNFNQEKIKNKAVKALFFTKFPKNIPSNLFKRKRLIGARCHTLATADAFFVINCWRGKSLLANCANWTNPNEWAHMVLRAFFGVYFNFAHFLFLYRVNFKNFVQQAKTRYSGKKHDDRQNIGNNTKHSRKHIGS